MKKLLIDGKFKTEIPQSWDEITFEQFYRLELWKQTKELDLIRALAILTTLPYEIWNKSNYGDFKHIVLPNIEWLSKPLKIRKIRMKDKIEIMGKVIEIPKNAEVETLGQKVAIDLQFAKYGQMYKENTKLAFYQMGYAMAVYCSPKISENDFDLEHTAIVQMEIQKMPAIDIIPIASFFLQKFSDSTRWSGISQVRNSIKMSVMQILHRLKNSVSLKRGMRLQEDISQSLKKS